MKKSLLCILAVGSTLAVSAQINTSIVSAKKSRNDVQIPTIKQTSGNEKTQGDVLYSNDFSTPSDWTFTNESPHTAGDWAIVNAVPASLVSQAGNYGFPTAMLSESGGNFALINSDGAGSTGVQNALLTTATDIDIAAALTGGGSALNTPLLLRFTEIYRHYYETYYVEVSIDGGATYTQFQVNPPSEVPTNVNSGNPDYEVLNITSVIGAGNWTSNVRVRFRYMGNYDWFWGIDDVEIVEAFDNEIKVTNFYHGTPEGTSLGLDYFIVPESQASFPGITFGATVRNDGSVTQPDVALNATSGAYDETGTTVSLAMSQVDSVSVETPYMLSSTVGDYVVDVTTTMMANDTMPENNEVEYTFRRDAYLYGRDNGVQTGGIAQVTSQNDAELRIGNVFEIFDDAEFTSIQVKLLNQATAVGQDFNAEIWFWDGSEYQYGGETDIHTITDGDLNTFVTLPISGGSYSAVTGDELLVFAHHFGGANEIGFGYAQNTYLGTVLGITANNELFQLTDPNAIMVRLSDAPLSVDENALQANLSVFPNPASDNANVTFELNNTQNATVVVTDLSGKAVATIPVTSVIGKNKVEINTTEFAAGIYTVTLTTEGASATQKLVVRK